MSVTANNQDYISAKLTNSEKWDGMTVPEARSQIIQHISDKGLGRSRTTYRIRDRSVSRQRYWGSPIPVYYTFADNEKVPFFEFDDNVRGVKKDKETIFRKTSCGILKNKNGEVLLIKRNIDNMHTFPSGGLDEGETFEDAVVREFMEETGYKVKVVKQIGEEIHRHFYHALKGVNNYTITRCFQVELLEDEIYSINEDEKKKHIPERINISKLERSSLDNEMKYFLKTFLGENIAPPAYTDRYNAYNPHPDKSKRIPHLIPDDDLPVILPLDLPNYKPAGKSPLEDHPSFKYYRPSNKKVPFFEAQEEHIKFRPTKKVVARKMVGLIVEHPNEDKYLLIKRNDSGKYTSIGGGIEKGDTLEQTVRKELLEESGYFDIKQMQNLHHQIQFSQFAPHKDINRYGIADIYFVKLNSLQKNDIDKKELDLHTPERIDISEVDNLLELELSKYIWKYFLYTQNKGSIPQASKYIDHYNKYNPQPVYLRECDTLDTFMCSSFYYLRFLDPHNTDQLISPQNAKNMPVDLYIGGKEHTVGHLIYSRFIYKFLRDHGYVASDYPEPFRKLVHQGMVHAHDGRKMSKRRGNVIDPMTIVDQFGSDTLRLYIGFMGPVEASKNRNPDAVAGIKRFVDRVERLYDKIGANIHQDISHISSILHGTIKGVTQDLEILKFNTAISKIMVLANAMHEQENITQNDYETLLLLLSPFATQFTEKLRSKLGYTDSIYSYARPSRDEAMIADADIDLPIQISGKMRGSITVSAGATQEEVIQLVMAEDRFAKYITSDIRKVIYIQDKICNIIV